MLFSNMRETWFSSLNIVTLKCSVMHAAGYNALCDLPKIPLSSVDAAWRMIMNWNIQKQNLSWFPLIFCHEADIIVFILNISPGSNILKTLHRKGNFFIINVEECQVIDEPCTEKLQKKREGTVEMKEWIVFHSCRGYSYECKTMYVLLVLFYVDTVNLHTSLVEVQPQNLQMDIRLTVCSHWVTRKEEKWAQPCLCHCHFTCCRQGQVSHPLYHLFPDIYDVNRFIVNRL